MAEDPSGPTEVGDTDEPGTEPGHDPGETILDAIHQAFAPRPPRYRPPAPDHGPPGTEPVALRRRTGRSRELPPSLFGPTAAERRERLRGIAAGGILPGEVEGVGRLLTTDPDPLVRSMAAEALAASVQRVPPSVIAAALSDPQDSVRREAVALAVAGGPEMIRSLLPMATDRRWPLAQSAVLEAVPGMVERAGGLPPRDLGDLLASVAILDPPPLPAERAGLAALGRAIGPRVLIGLLGAQDVRRLGAARLLSLSGLPLADRALARLQEDPSEEIRRMARTASRALPAGGQEIDQRPPLPESSERSVNENARRDGVELSEPFADEPALIASLARALTDPGEPVRTQARAALELVERKLVTDWVTETLEQGTVTVAQLAATVAERLGVVAAGAGLLRRAAAAQPEGRGPYLAALRALGLDPPDLAGLVGEVDPGHRQVAVRLVWEVGGQAVVPHLTPLLGDSSGPVRMAVVEVLADSGDPAATAIARERLAVDSSAAVRATAIHALARSEPEVRLEALARAMTDPDPDVRAIALEALPEDREETIDLLVPAFRDRDDRVWRAALSHLARLPKRYLPLLWAALREAPAAKREEMLRALEAVDPGDLMELAAPNARAAAPADRGLAVEVAARSGSVEATGLVLAALEDPDPTVRRTAAAAMTTLRAPAAVGSLARSLWDPQAEVRVEAIRAIGLIDDDTVPAILIDALRDPEVRVREMAADALTRWHSPGVAMRLASALASPDIRRSAGEVLERMGGMAVEALSEVAAGNDPEAAASAGSLLERIVGPGPFVDRLGSIEPGERLRAVQVLVAMGGAAACEALASALSDPDVRVRSRAATALGALGYVPALKQLRRMFLTDPVSEAASAAETALRALGAVRSEEEPPAPAPADPSAGMDRDDRLD